MIAIARGWWIVVLLALVGAGAGYGALSVVTPTYTSAGQLLLTPVATQEGNAALGATDYVSARARAYAAIAAGPDFRIAVLQELGLDTDSEYPEFAAEAVANTTLVSVIATDPSPERAQQTVEVVSALVAERVSALDDPSAQTAQVRVDVVSQPLLPLEPSAPSTTTFVAFGLLAGAVVGAALASVVGRPRRSRAERRRAAAPDTRGGTGEDAADGAEEHATTDDGPGTPPEGWAPVGPTPEERLADAGRTRPRD